MKWHFLAAGYDGTKLFLYEDGILKQTKTIGSDTIRTSAHTVKIGGSTVANEWLNGLIDEVRIYNRALSENEIRYHYNHTLPKGALSPLAMKEDPSLVGYWSFNEGNGTIISDQSGNNNNGTLYLGSSGNTDPSKAWSPGISGTALSFDGVDDRVVVPRSASLEPSKITIIAWIYPLAYSTTYPRIVDKEATNGGYLLLLDPSPSNTIEFAWKDSSGNQNSLYSTIPYSINKWTFLAAVFDGNTAYLYIDGVLNNTKISTITFSPGTANVTIGNNAILTRPFNGLIDEVRIYNRALSEQEILEHYRNSKYYLASHFGPKTNCREDPGSCIDYGLVSYWSFDEGAGTTAYDASGKGNNGTLVNGPKWTNGKFGQALSFDGVDDYVEVPNSPSLNPTVAITIMAWIKPFALASAQGIVDKGDGTTGYRFIVSDTNPNRLKLISRYLFANGIESSDVLVNNTWQHIAGVISGTSAYIYYNGILVGSGTVPSLQTTSINLIIGKKAYVGSVVIPFKGLIDEVRIYNRALSEEEIRYLYNRGAPIAHWKFDEGKGNIAYDSSGNGNNGTIYGAQWVQGKFGSALSFDGVDDYVQTPIFTPSGVLNSFPLTVSAWIYYYPDTGKTYTYISNWAGSYTGWFIQKSNANRFYIAIGTGSYFVTTDVPITTEGWVHTTAVIKGVGRPVEFYLNGTLVKSATLPSYSPGYNYLTIGAHPGPSMFIRGLIDDVRIYNYARTPEQILQDYNAGLSAHFK